jgi:hypothetical protein
MKYLTPALFGLMLSGGLIASSALAAPAAQSPVQNFTIAQTESLAPVSIETEQLAQLADVLVGILYFGLPCACLLVVLLHHQRATQAKRLAARLVPIRVKSRRS